MKIIDGILAEFEQEAKTTHRVLEAVPEEHLDWKPHTKSMSLGRLAGHVAEIPFYAGPTFGQDVLDFGESDFEPYTASGRDELLARHDAANDAFRQAADGYPDEKLFENWSMRRGEQVLFEAPRLAVVRSFILKHQVHHRGQLSVYLRLLDVPVPSIYGPSADDNPWG